MGVAAVIAVLGGYYADNQRRLVINDPITLHRDEAQCVYGPFSCSHSLWRPEFELDGKISGSWFHCLPIRIRGHNLSTTAEQVAMVWACAAKRRQ